jgi:hypothetical protein
MSSGVHHWLKKRSTREERKPVTRNDDDDDNNNNNNNNNQRTTENGNHTEETQHGPSPAPPDIGATAKQGSIYNKRIRWSREEMKEVVWYFLCVKDY